MTVSEFIDLCEPARPLQAKELASFNGIKLEKPVMNLRINKAYELARILDIDAPEMIEKIIQTELMS